jgi:hypothetical protein
MRKAFNFQVVSFTHHAESTLAVSEILPEARCRKKKDC